MAYDYCRVASVALLNEQYVEKLRKDFLTLMKNVPRVKDYNEALTLKDAFRVYSTRFDEFFGDAFLNKSLKYDKKISEDYRKYIDHKVRVPFWSFYIELRLPLQQADDYYSEAARFSQFEQERTRWSNKVKRLAAVFWKILREALEAYEGLTSAPEGIPVRVTDVEQVSMEGIPVRVYGFEDGDKYLQEHNPDYMERFKEALRLYKRRAQKVLPWMLQHQLPIELRFDEFGLDGEAGRYLGQTIQIVPSANSSVNNPNVVAKTIPHEMGHHLFNLLDHNATTFWIEAIRGDYEPIDLQKLLEVWPETMKYPSDFVDHMTDKDPVLALQIDAASFGIPLGGRTGIKSREDVEKMVQEGQTYLVPKNPITGYAGKNGEESFCEAVGLLVGYGPSALLPVIKHWLDLIVPTIKMSSIVDNVAARWVSLAT